MYIYVCVCVCVCVRACVCVCLYKDHLYITSTAALIHQTHRVLPTFRTTKVRLETVRSNNIQVKALTKTMNTIERQNERASPSLYCSLCVATSQDKQKPTTVTTIRIEEGV